MLLGNTCSGQPILWHLLSSFRRLDPGTSNNESSILAPSVSVSESASSRRYKHGTFHKLSLSTYIIISAYSRFLTWQKQRSRAWQKNGSIVRYWQRLLISLNIKQNTILQLNLGISKKHIFLAKKYWPDCNHSHSSPSHHHHPRHLHLHNPLHRAPLKLHQGPLGCRQDPWS